MCQASRSVLDLTRKFKEEQSSRNTSVSVGSADHVHGNLLDAGVPRIQDVRQNISGIGLKAFVLHILPNDIGVRSHMVTPWSPKTMNRLIHQKRAPNRSRIAT